MTASESEIQPHRHARRLRQALRALVGLVVVAFIALLAYGLSAKAPDTRIDERLARAEAAPAPGFELAVLQRGDLGPALADKLRPALGDGRVNLEELRGTPVILNFWASWCVPCRVEAPFLERTWREQRSRGVLLVGLNMQDLIPDARAFMREFNDSYLNIRDPSNDVARRWGLTGLPETFFITADGRVVAHVIGVVSESQMRDGLAAAETGRPVGSIDGGARRRTR